MKPQICAVITDKDLEAIAGAAALADLFEVRIDLIGEGWPEVVRHLTEPWIATNRLAAEGGRWQESEARRKEELLKAIELGASYVDIELATPNLGKVVALFKKRARCIVSYHNMEGTPAHTELKATIKKQLDAGADICKVVGTANSVEDNLDILKLIAEFPEKQVIAFAMGPLGTASRIMSPLAGSPFTYAAVKKGGESAAGQLTVQELADYYGLLR
jgi:3-dehydroquinate dehydratase type I